MKADLARFVNNTNGLSISGAVDSEYIEMDIQYEDVVIEGVVADGDLPDLPEGAILRTLNVADLVAVYDAAKALITANAPGDAPNGVRYGDAFSNAFTALDNAVAVAGR